MIATQGAAGLPLAERVAAEIRAYMARRRLSQTALATLLGWKQQYLSRRLTGSVPFDVNEIGALAEIFDVTPETFFRAPDEHRSAGGSRINLFSWRRKMAAA